MRTLSLLAAVLVSLVLAPSRAWSQDDSATPQDAVAYCTYEDGSQLTVRYKKVSLDHKNAPSNGKVWSPGDVPMLLFTEVPVMVENTELPVGAYSMFVIPEKDKWILIINKGVTAGAPYDEHLDLVRVPMSLGKLSRPLNEIQIAVGHIAPKLCSLRIDLGGTGAWADGFSTTIPVRRGPFPHC